MNSKPTRAKERRRRRARRQEQGIALLTVMMVMVLVVTLALSAIDSSEQELRAGGQSRAVNGSLYAAEAGVEFAIQQLNRGVIAPFTFNLLTDGTTVQSRSRDDATAQPILEGGIGEPPPEYQINIGSGYVNETYQVNVTAGGGGRPVTELEVKLGILAANSGS